MNDFFGVGSSSNVFDSYFGTSSNSGSSSFLTGLGDLKMIQSGAYKKSLKAYYATQKSNKSDESGATDSDKESIKDSGKADSKTQLSLVKSTSQKLYQNATALKNKDYSKKDFKTEDVLSDVKKFISSYNDTLNSTKKLNSYSILQTAVWSTEQMNTAEGLLNKVGINIKDDNTLEIDEDAFKKARTSDVKALFAGTGSLASRIAQKASTMANQSNNQLAVNSGKSFYTMRGLFT